MARRRHLLALAAATAATAVTAGTLQSASLAGTPAGAVPPPAAGPSKVVIIVVDALSREIVEKYAMSNVQQMMQDGVNARRAYLGHTGSVTVVTHNVLTTGVLPKHMGWTDEGYRDVDDLLPDTQPTDPDLYITSNFGSSEMFALQNDAGYPKLADYLQDPGNDPVNHPTTFTISPKGYAAWAFGGQGSDSTITFGSGPECTEGGGAWRKPTGINVPSYILGTPCSRFWVHSGFPQYAYDTNKLPALLYPLDSDRYVTGKDPAHQGGDVWAADAAIQVMRNSPDWNGIFVTLPGVDKAAHMWGGTDDPGPTGPDGDAMTHMDQATATADEQVGKILDELEDSGDLDDTLVVLTADHGSVAAKRFYGEDVASRDYGYNNWYYGDPQNDKFYNLPQTALQPLVDTGNVGLSYSDSMLRVWLKDQSPAKVTEAADVMEDLPAVTAVWVRNGDHYDRVSAVDYALMKTRGERNWFDRRAQELVDTEAADYGPDVIATLPDNTTYSIHGDHGGIQRASQQIPIVFAGGGIENRTVNRPMRSIDVMPTVLRALGIEPDADHPMDGAAYRLLPRRVR